MIETETETYSELNKSWKETCKVVLGKEIGELSEYDKWLSSLNNPRFVKKSSISGMETVFTSSEFNSDSKFIGMDELDFNKKFEPLTINEIKDIDSIREAVDERIYYCGNIVLGNSKFIEKSSNVSDSFFVYDSVKIDASRNIAQSQYLRLCENVFGTNEGGEGKFCIHCSILYKNTRCFELWNSPVCSDCYYSYGLENCNEAFFSFNVIGKNYLIGNLQLPKDKYLIIKRNLLEEISGELKRNKNVLSLIELVSKSEINHSEAKRAISDIVGGVRVGDKNQIESSFSKTSTILFGKPLTGKMDDYSEWLKQHTIVPYSIKSALSECSVPMSKWPGLSQLPPERVVTSEEAIKIGQQVQLSESAATAITLATAPIMIGHIAYFTPEHMVGVNSNLIECQWGSNASNCHRSVICVYSKDCAYCSWPRSSQYCFGCGIVFDSEFSMKCYDSVKLTRCFEVDGGRGCSDTYFSHNVEGLQNCAFCFNAKSKQYSVGNSEVGRERFMEVKKMVQEWVLEELEKKTGKSMPSIYFLG
jgi:hypothetical protein